MSNPPCEEQRNVTAFQPDERELVRRCLEGDRRAWESFVERYGRLVYLVPQRYGLTREACDDVYQSVFLVALRHLGSVRDAASMPKWLMTVAHRECWHVTRRRSLTLDAETCARLATDSPPDDRMARWEMQASVQEALSRLGGKCERLLRALFLEGESEYSQIAAKLRMPIGSIGPVRNRCLKKLLELLPEGLRDLAG